MSGRRLMMAGGGVVNPYAVELRFPGTSTTAPNPTPNTGLAGDCTFSGPTPYYGNDSSGTSFKALSFSGGATRGTIANHPSIDNIWSGGNTFGWDFLAAGFGGGSGGRFLDNRNISTGYGHATFVQNASGLKVSFLIADSTGLKLWRINDPLSLLVWYIGNSIFFNSDDKANDPIFTIGGLVVASSKISDTTGGATGPWETDAGNDMYVGNNADLTRGINGNIDNLIVGA